MSELTSNDSDCVAYKNENIMKSFTDKVQQALTYSMFMAVWKEGYILAAKYLLHTTDGTYPVSGCPTFMFMGFTKKLPVPSES